MEKVWIDTSQGFSLSGKTKETGSKQKLPEVSSALLGHGSLTNKAEEPNADQ